MNIGVTDTLKSSFKFYVRWLHRAEPDLAVVALSYPERNLLDLDHCHGLLLTGGGDVNPRTYGRTDVDSLVKDVRRERDEFELNVIEKALLAELPILAICRGMQVFNVALGGSLIPDLETAGFLRHQKSEHEYPSHPIHLEQSTFLHDCVREREGLVSTNHHQAVDRLGTGLRVTAKSPDGVIEGLEWAEPRGKPFLQLMQWHPERMEDYDSPFSKAVLERFLVEAKRVERKHRIQPSIS